MVRQVQLLDLRRRKPFVPFRITTNNGRSISVTSAFSFAVNEVMILIPKESGGCITIRLEDIAAIDDLPPIDEPTNGQNTGAAISRLHQHRPFRPFALRFGDGHALAIEHPEMLAYAPKRQTAVVFREDGTFEMVDLSLVTGLEVAAE